MASAEWRHKGKGSRVATWLPSTPSVGETLQQEGLGDDHPLDLGRVHALVRCVDPCGRQVLGAPQDELGVRGYLLQGLQQRDRAAAASLPGRLPVRLPQ